MFSVITNNAYAATSATTSSDQSSLVSRNITVGNHRTSVRLEPAMWDGFREICRREHLSMHNISTAVSQTKPENTSLTAALRVFIMAYFRAAATEDGHTKAGHGPGGGFMLNWSYRSGGTRLVAYAGNRRR